MSNMKEHPRYNVISLRITDEEKYVLQQVTKQNKMTTSKALREAFSMLIAKVGGEYTKVCN